MMLHRRQLPRLFLALLPTVLLCRGAEETTTCSFDDDSNDEGSCRSSTIVAPPLLPPPVEDADGDSYIDSGFGKAQSVGTHAAAAGAGSDTIRERLQEMVLYMQTQVLQQEQQEELCLMRHELCATWATQGECETNPGYMKLQCAPVCFSCGQQPFELLCPLPDNMSEHNIWGPGDLNAMFENIVALTNNASRPEDTGHLLSYQLQVLSRPSSNSSGGAAATATDDDVDDDAPWVLVLDNFLTDQECETLIRLGTDRGYEQSKGIDSTKKLDGTFDSVIVKERTSSNSWCLDDCYKNATTQRVLQKIEGLTGIPDANAEHLQLLKYEEGQFYQTHHDYIPFHRERAHGVRVATFFLYLNDVPEGGGTNFPLLNLTVEAKRGRALIWPSVLDQDPESIDPRTDHQALPVMKGLKYGANAWLHQRDFKAVHAVGCA